MCSIYVVASASRLAALHRCSLSPGLRADNAFVLGADLASLYMCWRSLGLVFGAAMYHPEHARLITLLQVSALCSEILVMRHLR